MYTIESNKSFVILKYNGVTIAFWIRDCGFFTSNITFNSMDKIINALGNPYWSR